MSRPGVMHLACLVVAVAVVSPALVWLAEALVPVMLVGTACFVAVRADLYLTNRW